MGDGQVQDLVVEQLKLLRTDLRGLRDDFRSEISGLRSDVSGLREEQRATNARLDGLQEEQRATNARLEVIEVALRDLAQQIVMLARAVHATLEHRRETDAAIEDLRQRLRALEGRSSQQPRPRGTRKAVIRRGLTTTAPVCATATVRGSSARPLARTRPRLAGKAQVVLDPRHTGGEVRSILTLLDAPLANQAGQLLRVARELHGRRREAHLGLHEPATQAVDLTLELLSKSIEAEVGLVDPRVELQPQRIQLRTAVRCAPYSARVNAPGWMQ